MYLNRGYLIGLTGYIFTLDKVLLKDWLNLITLDRLVIETDAPYMGWKGCRINQKSKKNSKYPNIPSSLPLIADYISDISSIPVNNIIKQTTINALKFLRKI
jgi:TatD DNase family protein